MDEKTPSLGKLRVRSKFRILNISDEHRLAHDQTFRLPNGLELTPVLDANCGHLTFVEFPAFHLAPKRRQQFDRKWELTWAPASASIGSKDADILSPCHQKNLERLFESTRERALIAKFFQVARNKEPYEVRKERLATQPLEAFKGFRKDLTCLGFQYREGETFHFADTVLCKRGAHVCLFPRDVFQYYPRRKDNRYFRVLICGAKHSNYKSVAEQIKLLDELSADELNKLSGVFETRRYTYLQIRGDIIGELDHRTNDVSWRWNFLN